MTDMIKQFDKISGLTERFDQSIWQALQEISITRVFKKGSLLVRQDEVSGKSFHIQSGIARKYFTAGNKEITTEFCFADDMVLAFNSYTLQQPSREFIECLTDVTAAVTDRQSFEQLKQKFPQLQQLDLLLTELYALWLEQKLFDFHTLDATQRYLQLLEKEPEILQHIQLTHIASYLGISLETLSRIRAKI